MYSWVVTESLSRLHNSLSLHERREISHSFSNILINAVVASLLSMRKKPRSEAWLYQWRLSGVPKKRIQVYVHLKSRYWQEEETKKTKKLSQATAKWHRSNSFEKMLFLSFSGLRNLRYLVSVCFLYLSSPCSREKCAQYLLIFQFFSPSLATQTAASPH